MSSKTPYLRSSGLFFHVYNRSVSHTPLFFQQQNYTYFLKRMVEHLNPAALILIAYALMPNHYHMILRQEKPYAIPHFIKAVCDGYAKAINAWARRRGHLFSERYKIKLVDTTDYLLDLSGYIHLNPVRGELVRSPNEWAFSSCREYCGLRNSDFLATSAVFSLLGKGVRYIDFLNTYGTPEQERIRRYLVP
jgi:putative transposase